MAAEQGAGLREPALAWGQEFGLSPRPQPYIGVSRVVQRPSIIVRVLSQVIRLPQNAHSVHGGLF